MSVTQVIQHLFSRQFMAFLFVGGSATLLQLVLLTIFIEFLGVTEVLASATAYLVSAGYNYILNYHLTFGSRESHWVTLPKFILVVVVGVSINTGVFAACLPYLPYIIAQVIAIGAALVANYVLHKFWIYRRKE